MAFGGGGFDLSMGLGGLGLGGLGAAATGLSTFAVAAATALTLSEAALMVTTGAPRCARGVPFASLPATKISFWVAAEVEGR